MEVTCSDVFSHQEDEDEEVEGAIDQEYHKVRRQLRIVDDKRRNYEDQISKCLIKQKNEIDQLLNESKLLSRNLDVVFSKPNQLKDHINKEKITSLIEIMNDINKESEVASKKITDLDDKINQVEKLISKTEKENGVKPGQEMTVLLTKRMQILEKNLQEKMMQFNTQLANNVQFRQELDHYRIEKIKYDEKFRHLHARLKHIAKEHAQYLKEASDAYSLRDDVANKLKSMESKDTHGIFVSNLEMQEFNRTIDQTSKLQKFLLTKLNDRTAYKEEEERKKAKAKSSGDDETDTSQMSKYNTVFAQLQEVTGMHDLNIITKNFVQREHANFAMFQFINELCDEELRIKDELRNVKREIRELQEQDVQLETQRNEYIRGLEVKGNDAGTMADEVEKKLAEVSQSLQEVLDGIDLLFRCLECDDSCLTSMLGFHDGLTENTVMQYMGIMEQKLNELLNTYHLLTMLKRDPMMLKNDSDMSFIRHFDPYEVPRAHIKAPEVRSDHIMAFPDKPLTVEELRACAQKVIQMQENEDVLIRKTSIHDHEHKRNLEKRKMED
ncbi:coiled-coil domain-containing protein 63-like isoform X1 [Gigantopelta aegis]|uniref:coiled-coil domain-containing protein 63-like isoform X1 n=1 Tax=Gigantopelta aegis TaxID=1735272 RepID=UPI001B887D79|nr:coiled-coil domain-containing protein 63-like isoform X1 [Gigantopelta aegis]XP_041349038.1 coiled-coil domain-containing protein 63-like isoform X1 [Gigantopelta aegis]